MKPKVLEITEDSLKAAMGMANCPNMAKLLKTLCVPPPVEEGWVLEPDKKLYNGIRYIKGGYQLVDYTSHPNMGWRLYSITACLRNDETQIAVLYETVSPQEAQAWANRLIAEREKGEHGSEVENLQAILGNLKDEITDKDMEIMTLREKCGQVPRQPTPIAPGARYRLNGDEVAVIKAEKANSFGAVNLTTNILIWFTNKQYWFAGIDDLHAALIAAGATRIE